VAHDHSYYEAVVIGSGFGGAVSFCRLSQKWGGKVLLLERGKRYPKGAFARSPRQMADNFWNIEVDGIKRPRHIQERQNRGLFDVRLFKKMDSVFSAGYGGGSLIYANVFLEPPDEVFQQGWPAKLTKKTLKPYYAVARRVLGARPIPSWQHNERRRIVRTELFQQFAEHEQRTSKLADICVFFGKEYSYGNGKNPLEIGEQERNPYGSTQTSCTYCGECDVGCNTHAKNTLDLNYLYAAEQHHNAQVLTECRAELVVPLDADGKDDPSADGSHGYRIEYLDFTTQKTESLFTRRVIVSAGTFGTNELLLRCRDVHKTLPGLSTQLGSWFSGNGDFLSFVPMGEKLSDPNYGPVITQFTDYNLFANFSRNDGFVFEDASYPVFLAWLIEGVFPVDLPRKISRLLKQFWGWLVNLIMHGSWANSLGHTVHEVLAGDLSSKSSVLLCMGLDRGDGTLTLNDKGRIDLDWPQESSMNLYRSILAAGERFRAFARGKWFIPLPTWNMPVKHNVTVHPLGGCILADTPEQGVVSAAPANRGEVFGYRGLYIADGSILPGAVGANPIATITATAEWIAEGITGIKPDASLGVQ
jgi:cholesterol oxidase